MMKISWEVINNVAYLHVTIGALSWVGGAIFQYEDKFVTHDEYEFLEIEKAIKYLENNYAGAGAYI